MKTRLFFCVMALVAVSVLSTHQVSSQVQDPQQKTDKKPDASADEMMKKWMEMAAPGESHKVLDSLVGKWDTVTRLWMEPGKLAAETKGTAEVKWIMDGRYLQEETTGQIMGAAHKSVGVTGFDNFKKKYVKYWFDNMGTAIYSSEGFLDPSGKLVVTYGKMDDPSTGERDRPLKFITRIIDKNKFVLEIYDLPGSTSEFKSGEITYTRK
jgi:hypothetical protein